jgi:hypothetical protein
MAQMKKLSPNMKKTLLQLHQAETEEDRKEYRFNRNTLNALCSRGLARKVKDVQRHRTIPSSRRPVFFSSETFGVFELTEEGKLVASTEVNRGS